MTLATRSRVGHRLLVAIIAVLTADQLTKALASRGAVGGVIAPVTNSEMSLGIASASRWATVLLAAGLLVLFGGYVARRTYRGQVPVWVSAAIVGGAASNLIDRLAFGAVRDFLVTPLAIVNLADLAVVAGLAGLVCCELSLRQGKGVTT